MKVRTENYKGFIIELHLNGNNFTAFCCHLSEDSPLAEKAIQGVKEKLIKYLETTPKTIHELAIELENILSIDEAGDLLDINEGFLKILIDNFLKVYKP